MTTPLPLSVPATNVPHTHVRRQDLSELVAGIPNVLGAPPTDSLVLYTFGGVDTVRLATTLTGKLPPPTATDSLVARALAAARLIGATAVIAVVIGGEETPTPSNPLPHRTLVETLRYTFESAGVVLVHASWVRRTTPGEPWRCYDDITCHDTVPDAAMSTLTAAAAVAGVATFSTREDLANLLIPDTQQPLGTRSALLDKQLKKPSTPYTGEELTADLELIRQTVEQAAQTRQLPTFTDHQLVRLATAISHDEVRDDCLAIALSSEADAAERVWLVLVRALPAPERAEAAFLLAISTFLRGEVVLAALSLEAALEANPAHELAPILRTNLTRGTTPTQLRAMLIESVIRATELRMARAAAAKVAGEDDPPWDTSTPAPTTRPTDPDGSAPISPPRPTETTVPTPMPATPEPTAEPLPAEVPVPATQTEEPAVARTALPTTSAHPEIPAGVPASVNPRDATHHGAAPPVATTADIAMPADFLGAPTYGGVAAVPEFPEVAVLQVASTHGDVVPSRLGRHDIRGLESAAVLGSPPSPSSAIDGRGILSDSTPVDPEGVFRYTPTPALAVDEPRESTSVTSLDAPTRADVIAIAPEFPDVAGSWPAAITPNREGAGGESSALRAESTSVEVAGATPHGGAGAGAT